MKRPTISRFLGVPFRVRWRKRIEQDGDECDGLTDKYREVITIASGISPHRERATLLHELVHQMADTGGWGWSPKLEEEIAERIGTAFAAHISDNPSFWRYVTRPI